MNTAKPFTPFAHDSDQTAAPAWDAPQPSSSPPFWPRCARALVLLFLATATHYWLLPRALSPLPVVPAPARAAFAPELLARVEPAAQAPSVTIVTEYVTVSPPPVGTSGFIESVPRPMLQSVSVGAAPEPASAAATNDAASVAPPLVPISPLAVAPAAAPPAEVAEPPASVPAQQRSAQHVMTAATTDAAPIVARPALVRTNVDQQQRVRQLIQQYAAAFERLDVNAAKAVWPTVNEKALRRAFDQLEAQQVTFESCGITIEGMGAQARCQGEATYRPRIGSRTLHLSAREWTFDLAQADGGWRIVDARVR